MTIRELFDAMLTGRPVRYLVSDYGTVLVNAIEREDGSGKSFNLTLNEILGDARVLKVWYHEDRHRHLFRPVGSAPSRANNGDQEPDRWDMAD